jgi:integrase
VKDRYVPLAPHLLTLLRAHWRTHRHPVWRFPARWQLPEMTGPMSARGVEVAVQVAAAECGFQKHVTVHTLRHSWGRSFGRLVNASLDAACEQAQVFSPWRFSPPSPG